MIICFKVIIYTISFGLGKTFCLFMCMKQLVFRSEVAKVADNYRNQTEKFTCIPVSVTSNLQLFPSPLRHNLVGK